MTANDSYPRRFQSNCTSLYFHIYPYTYIYPLDLTSPQFLIKGGGDSEESEADINTRDICLLCNTLMYWFLLGNAKNQELAFGELEFFLDSLDEDIKSHLVIRAIFKNNESLMKQMPHSHLNAMVSASLIFYLFSITLRK
jgi:hypothetical protein